MNEKVKNKIKNRDSNIELLRIIAIFGVIMLHYNFSFGGLEAARGIANRSLLLVLDSL